MSQSGSRRFVFHDFAPTSVSFREEVVRGLSRPRKAIAAKFFYDKEGSRLFEAICEQPEYYPTRVETSIMQRYSGEMAELIGPDCLLIEYGSGASRKTRFLLDAARQNSFACGIYSKRVWILPIPRVFHTLLGIRPALEAAFRDALGPRIVRLGPLQ